MWSLGIVPDEIVHQFPVKDFRIIQRIDVPVSKLLLDCPVEALQVSVGLGVPGVRSAPGHYPGKTSEVFQELSAVIGLNSADGKWGHTGEFLEEVPAVGRGIGLAGIAKANPVVTSMAVNM